MTIVTHPRPGVKVFQQFRTVTPTLVVPNLQAAVAGVAKQVVEAVDDTGVLNSEAFVTLPARFAFPRVGLGADYADMGGTTLLFSFNMGPTVTFTFPASAWTPTAVELKNWLDAQAIPGIRTVVEQTETDERVVIETTSAGQFASVQILGGTALALAMFDAPTTRPDLPYGEGGYKTVGLNGYDNYLHADPQFSDYPDPRNNLDELVIDWDTVRVFLDTGNSFQELLKTQGFLRGGTAAVSMFDDGDGDNLSPYIDIAGADLVDGAASVVGTVDWSGLTYPGDFGTFTLLIEIDGVLKTITFTNPADEVAALVDMNTGLGVSATASYSVSGQIVITTATAGPTGSVRILGGGTVTEATLGLTAGTFVQSKPGKATVIGTADISTFPTVNGSSLVFSVDGDPVQTVTFDGTVTSATLMAAFINNAVGRDVASVVEHNTAAAGGESLALTSPLTTGGEESVVRIYGASTASLLTALGLTAGRTAGNPFAVQVGDELWVDGLVQGLVTEVVSASRIRLDVELLLTFTGARYYFVAKDLDNEFSSSSRPTSELVVDESSGTLFLRHELFRDTAGVPTQASSVGIYLGYTALRQDVSPVGEDFNGLRFGSLVDLGAALSPIDTQNPLGLGMFFAMLNAPGIEVFGVGVDEVTDTLPYGTLEAWTRTFEFLESKDVYSIAGMTHDDNVAEVAEAHVNAMSDPEVGLERMYFHNPVRPTRKSNTLVASGATGNATTASSTFDTGVPNLPALIAGVGVGPGPYPTDTGDLNFVGLFLEMESDTNKYLIQSVSGSVVTIAATVVGNDDAFYYSDGAPVFADAVVDRPFSVAIRGALLTNRTDEAVAYSDIPRGIRNRRIVVVAPDQAKATIDGLQQILPGFYMGAGLCGKTSSKGPSDPLTEVSLAGFDGVIGSTDRYSEYQMTILAGGGLWTMYAQSEEGPIITRQQLTSDMTTLEKQEFSILTAVDFTAKFVRGSLRNFIGRFNITTPVMDSVNTVIDGISKYLTENKVLKSFEVERLLQDTSRPDRLLVDADLGVFYPLNEIKVTLII